MTEGVLQVSRRFGLALVVALSATLAAPPAGSAAPQGSDAAPVSTEARSNPTNALPTDDPTRDSPDDDPAPPSAPAPNSDVFVPSEEISEDFTISFPVDI